MINLKHVCFLIILLTAGSAAAQVPPDSPAAAVESSAVDRTRQESSNAPAAEGVEETPSQPARRSIGEVTSGFSQDLKDSLEELGRLREQIDRERKPLAEKLARLEQQLATARTESQEANRQRDKIVFTLSKLQDEVKQRQNDATNLSNLLDEYTRDFDSRLHIAEIRQYRATLDAAAEVRKDTKRPQKDVYRAQTEVLSSSLDRLEAALGGTRIEGEAVNAAGDVKRGTFVLLGPAVLFASKDGGSVGTSPVGVNSLEATIVEFSRAGNTQAAAELVATGRGSFPLDVTLGTAHKSEATQVPVWEEIEQGGPVMWPIFFLAGAALLVALLKWLSLAFLRTPSQQRVAEMMRLVAGGDREEARKKAAALGGPVGEMLTVGVEHIDQPRDLMEEVMYEKVLSTRLRLYRLLPFISVSASSAPLLGLLGTVTGIIETFRVIKVQGAGDVASLSGGIGQALITTKWGLIVAIPSLLIYAFLSRKARGVIDQMEKSAIILVNQTGKMDEPAGRFGDDDNAADGGSVPTEPTKGPSGTASPATT